MTAPDCIHASRVRLSLDVQDELSFGRVKARFRQAARSSIGDALAYAVRVVPKDADLTIGRITLDLGAIGDGDIKSFQDRLKNCLRDSLRTACTELRAARSSPTPETGRSGSSAIGRDEVEALADFINLGIRPVSLNQSSFDAALQAGAARTATALSHKTDSAKMHLGTFAAVASRSIEGIPATTRIADGISPERVTGSDHMPAMNPDDPLAKAGAPNVHNPKNTLDPTQTGAALDSKSRGTSGAAFRETGPALSGLANSTEASPHQARPERSDSLTGLNDVWREFAWSESLVETYEPPGQIGRAAVAQQPIGRSVLLEPTDLEHMLRWAAVILRSKVLPGVLGAKRSSRAPVQSMPRLARDSSLSPVASTAEVSSRGDDRLAPIADEVRLDTEGIFPAGGLSEDAVSPEVSTAKETGLSSFESDSRTDPSSRSDGAVDPMTRAPVDLPGSAEADPQIRLGGALQLRAVLDALIASPDLFEVLRDSDVPIRSAVQRVLRDWQDGTLEGDAARELAALPLRGSSDSLSWPGNLVTARQSPIAQSTASLSARLGKPDGEPEPAGPQHVPDRGIAYATEGAGLVLLWPFLPRFLDQAGVVSDGAMTGANAAIHASHLIHGLSGRRHDHEPDLLLARILAGLDLTVAIGPAPDITDSEIQLSDTALDSVLAAWQLRGTSRLALQATFLDRPGTLTLSDAGWRLQVMDGPFDMLLDRIPWALSTVALPWMKLPIDVRWRR